MSHELSPQSEQFLASVVASGLYPSKEAALEAAVAALQDAVEQIPLLGADHSELVEQALESLQAGRGRAWSDSDWEMLRQHARNSAAANGRSAP